MAGDTETTESIAGLLNPVRMPRRHQVGLVSLAVLFVLPSLVREITVLKLTGALFFAVYVMTWDVVSGYTGEISFGHALFIGVGAYTSGILTHPEKLGIQVPIVAGILLGVLAAAAAGLLIGFPSLRLQGPYFSLVTLVAPIILLSVFRFFPDVTGGEIGLQGIPVLTDVLTGRLTLLGSVTVSWGAIATNYYVAFLLFLFALAVFLAVTRSDAGVVLTAIREDEVAVQAGGLNPAKFKLFAFLLSGAVGGLAGALFVHTHAQGFASASELLALVISIELIVAAIVGGMGTITGAAVGGLFFFLLRDTIRSLEQLVVPLPPFGRLVVDLTIPVIDKPLQEFDFLLFAVITLLVLFFVPRGLVPRLLAEARRLNARFDRDPVPDGGQTPLERTVETYARELRSLAGADGGTDDADVDGRGADPTGPDAEGPDDDRSGPASGGGDRQ